MKEADFAEISSWIAEAGLNGVTETELVEGFCRSGPGVRSAARPRGDADRHAPPDS